MQIKGLERAAGGGAGLVGGILVVGLVILTLAGVVFFLAHQQDASLQEAAAREERAELEKVQARRAQAESQKEAIEARAREERAAQQAHEAAQIEALAAEAPAAAPSVPAGEGPPEVEVGASLRYSFGESLRQGEVLEVRGRWVRVKPSAGQDSLWVNFERVAEYSRLPSR